MIYQLHNSSQKAWHWTDNLSLYCSLKLKLHSKFFIKFSQLQFDSGRKWVCGNSLGWILYWGSFCTTSKAKVTAPAGQRHKTLYNKTNDIMAIKHYNDDGHFPIKLWCQGTFALLQCIFIHLVLDQNNFWPKLIASLSCTIHSSNSCWVSLLADICGRSVPTNQHQYSQYYILPQSRIF